VTLSFGRECPSVASCFLQSQSVIFRVRVRSHGGYGFCRFQSLVYIDKFPNKDGKQKTSYIHFIDDI